MFPFLLKRKWKEPRQGLACCLDLESRCVVLILNASVLLCCLIREKDTSTYCSSNELYGLMNLKLRLVIGKLVNRSRWNCTRWMSVYFVASLKQDLIQFQLLNYGKL